MPKLPMLSVQLKDNQDDFQIDYFTNNFTENFQTSIQNELLKVFQNLMQYISSTFRDILKLILLNLFYSI